ncbi:MULTISPECIES: FAD:protein FMN transferase [Pseudoalteromonas]|uniref:FAD:protein FMN transferase n=1 Tax=Pseudoalteromonas amylolytica TaxID=1859457 RepID=A0A1S1MTD8_9GAMM|nr:MULTISPECIES: FAD:protein FMN transferase [Pseudoalteromonas]OHU89119.1 FAD:protein FMN transferase ApbE [Pseudoalteromonas sp. JW3]OHU92019.1 FAD:protein FMN transferase ApbE [Pseudoalteromonas amylolytica]
MARIFLPVLILLTLVLSGCDNSTVQTSGAMVINGKTMGTTYNIKVFPEGQALEQAQLKKQIDDTLVAVNQSMSPWVEDSEINQFNALSQREVMAISEDFRTVVAESIRLGESTKTLDVTMGPLIDLWGFGPDKRPTKRPSQAQLDDMRSRIGVDKLLLSEQGLAKTVDGLEVSFSATAKGFGIDKVAALLEQLGIHNYMVEIGGELRVSGSKPNDKPWIIAIEQPDAPMGKRQVHRELKLRDTGIATSGDYRIFYEMDGETFTHLIDPATGMPVKHELVSVTVLHPSAMTADGLATALTVMGTERAKAYAEQHQLAVYLISKSDQGLITYASEAFKPYL